MARSQKRKPGLVPIRELPLKAITPSRLNDSVYRPPSADDPDIQEMARSMSEHGVLQPLTVTQDGFILSGHRRYCAATLAGLETVPAIVENITRSDPSFPRLLVTHNQQRQKNISELLAEQVVQRSGEQAHRELVQYRAGRRKESLAGACRMEMMGEKRRAEISKAKQPMLDAVLAVLEQLQEFLPVSTRTIHYNLLNDPPLRHASKPDSRYRNDGNCYGDVSDLCTRARLAGLISMEAISDETRPVQPWNIHRSAGDFLQEKVQRFLRGYWRDLMQSQPNHVEVIGEKNTLLPIIEPVCQDYTVPLTISRGFCSLPPRWGIYSRWKKSGKQDLVLVVLSDHDPDGQMIADSFVRSLRDDFRIPSHRIHAVRAALTADQCQRFGIPSDLEAKPSSTNYRRFVEEHGTAACELEAVPPKQLQAMLRTAIESVLDLDAFRAEQDRERADAAEIDVARRRALSALGPMIGNQD